MSKRQEQIERVTEILYHNGATLRCGGGDRLEKCKQLALLIVDEGIGDKDRFKALTTNPGQVYKSQMYVKPIDYKEEDERH